MTSGSFDSSSGTVLSIQNVSKRFCRDLKRSLWYGVWDIFREVSGTRRDCAALRPKEFWAVKDVSLELKPAECLGLIGSNGAGKTTLLRMVSGIMKPDAGRIVVQGITAPLLALGAGFNPVLTGRENIHVNMAILGASRVHISRQLEAVVDFAEIEDAIDAPVQTYSSGMISRLGFACAIHVAPQILVVDEVLSVGDARFRTKCYRKLGELRRAGTSILLVSHNRGDILGICDRVAYLDQGRLKAVGEASETLGLYERDVFREADVDVSGEMRVRGRRDDATGIGFDRIFLSDEHGTPVESLTMASAGALRFDVIAAHAVSGVFLQIIIRDFSNAEEVVLHLCGDRENGFLQLPAGASTLAMEMPVVCLRPGLYTAKIALFCDNLKMCDGVESFRFRVRAAQGEAPMRFHQPHRWSLTNPVIRRAAQMR